MANGEDKITSWFREMSKLDTSRFPIGIGDDMAMVSCSDFAQQGFLITTDMLLDGVHFELEQCGMEQAGYKAIAASLSDCAAMATVPVCCVAAVAMQRPVESELLKQLYKGINTAGQMFNCQLIGGDITSWDGKFAINVTMISRPGNCEPVKRNGAKPGDVICVTGSLGGSLLGKHLNFIPRVNEGLRLTEICRINSMMDITDGLSVDLARICKASKTGAVIYDSEIPVSDAAKDVADPLYSALNDGEDFELLFTLEKNEFEKLLDQWEMQTVITQIGDVIEGNEISLIKNGSKVALEPEGFDHL